MIRPIINNNGTNALDLIDGRRNAMDLIDEVIDTLKQLTPNGRDYLGDRDRLIADRVTHFDRLNTLHSLREELLDEALHIQRQERAGA
jgi:hypothetical protein